MPTGILVQCLQHLLWVMLDEWLIKSVEGCANLWKEQGCSQNLSRLGRTGPRSLAAGQQSALPSALLPRRLVCMVLRHQLHDRRHDMPRVGQSGAADKQLGCLRCRASAPLSHQLCQEHLRDEGARSSWAYGPGGQQWQTCATAAPSDSMGGAMHRLASAASAFQRSALPKPRVCPQEQGNACHASTAASAAAADLGTLLCREREERGAGL